MALDLEITARQAADLLAERASVDEISHKDIVANFLVDARNYETSPPSVAGTRALFDLVGNADGSVTFAVYFQGKSSRAAGLTSVDLTRHSCGTLTGRFGDGMLTVADRDCPPEVAAAAGENSRSLSLTENAEKYGVDVGTTP